MVEKLTEDKKLTTDEILEVVKSSLEDDKGEKIVVIDLEGKTSIANYMVIATGGSNRHVATLAEHAAVNLKKHGLMPRVEGMDKADWVLVDAFDVILHVFREEVRDFYNLEKMWSAFEEIRQG